MQTAAYFFGMHHLPLPTDFKLRSTVRETGGRICYSRCNEINWQIFTNNPQTEWLL